MVLIITSINSIQNVATLRLKLPIENITPTTHEKDYQFPQKLIPY